MALYAGSTRQVARLGSGTSHHQGLYGLSYGFQTPLVTPSTCRSKSPGTPRPDEMARR